MTEAITGPIIGKALYHGKSSRLGVGNFIFPCTMTEQSRFLPPRFCTKAVWERLPMKVEVTKKPKARRLVAYGALGFFLSIFVLGLMTLSLRCGDPTSQLPQ
ncbi:hypothetical protein CSV86_017175 [Pseudomonas putida CSV86]|uniref:Uncharacterized protein n=1 Tax=Pseudomonas bharatica CSV86 TaxID=1005395 RepID=A0A7K4EHG9_9PSED|nr:hypothetical protein [Pseudomonas bharatica]NNJ16809.1 hypothetical protein [Pseudomonas bharatica CSV86]